MDNICDGGRAMLDAVRQYNAPKSGPSTCGPPDGSLSPVSDCDMADMGSCGNACCVVEIDITGGSSTKDAYQGLKG